MSSGIAGGESGQDVEEKEEKGCLQNLKGRMDG
jgi:hypothetical protein